MTWQELIDRCDKANLGFRNEHAHIVCLRRLEELNWLSLFSFITPGAGKVISGDMQLFQVIREATEQALEERMEIQLIIRHSGICAVAYVALKDPKAGYCLGHGPSLSLRYQRPINARVLAAADAYFLAIGELHR